MALSDELAHRVQETFSEQFEISHGWSIPSTTDITFDNQGKQIKLVSLFVDIRKSTSIVNAIGLENAARMYKAYVWGITKIVKERGGQILSFNGDGVVAGFVGPNTAENGAALSALNLNWYLYFYVKPQVDHLLGGSGLTFDYGIGIDSGQVLVVKVGQKGEDNHDLVWSGNPVNYSVKVNSLAEFPYGIYVSHEIFNRVHYSLAMYDSEFIWEAWNWAEKDKLLWRTRWWYGPDYIKNVPSTLQQTILTGPPTKPESFWQTLASKIPPPPQPPPTPSFWNVLAPPPPKQKTGLELLLEQMLVGDKLNKK